MNSAVDLTTPLEAHFTHHYVRTQGMRIHCVTAGVGAPVLLVPGWPQTWYAYRHVMQALAVQGYMAIAIDPPGLGDSDRPEHGYDTGSVANILHQTMKQLGFNHYHLVGHDVGMWIAYALASDHPEAVWTMTVTEAVIPGLAEAPPIFVSPEDNIFLWHFMFNQVSDLPELLITGRESAYLNFMFDRWAFKRHRVASETYIQAYSKPGSLRGGFAYYRAIPETILQNKQRARRSLTMPVLALGAEYATKDAPLLTLKNHASDLQGAVIAQCGHFVMEEAADEFIHHLLPFLRANVRG